MTQPFLANAYAKLDRTTAQIKDLRGLIGACLRYSSHKTVSRFDADRDEEIWSFQLNPPIPSDIAVIVGEVLHNLRVPLDYLACALARQNTGSDKGVYFPFGRDKDAFVEQAEQKCKKLPVEAVAMVRALKPYKGGNELLWSIHEMNRADKHREIAPINLRTGSNSLTYLTVLSGLVLAVGSRAGQHLTCIRRSAEEIAQMGSPTAVYEIGSGMQLDFGTVGCTAEQSLEYLTLTPGATVRTDMRPTFGIAFKSMIGGGMEPVDMTLQRMATLVREILDSFDKKFFVV